MIKGNSRSWSLWVGLLIQRTYLVKFMICRVKKWNDFIFDSCAKHVTARVENVVSHLKVKWSVPYRKLVDYFGFHPPMKLTTMKYITEIDTIYIYIYIYIYIRLKIKPNSVRIRFKAVKFLFFPRRDLNPHHCYTAAPFA